MTSSTPAEIFEGSPPEHYLLRVAASDLGRSVKALALSRLRLGAGNVVLDLGCGPGADLPAFAEAVGGGGRVIGLDTDRARVALAAERTAHLPQVEVRRADAHALGIGDASVDRAHTERVLQHVEDPWRVVAEVRRVLRPGGIAVFAEPDWDTLIIDDPDLAVARGYTRYVADEAIRNACIGRRLVGLATELGFSVDAVDPVTAVFRDVSAADRVLGLRRVTRRAVTAGYLPEREAEPWLERLATRPFFASATLFVVTVSAPSG